MRGIIFVVGFIALTFVCAGGVAPCRIEVVDKENGWPVPLVEFRTTHGMSFITDNAGVVAFDVAEMMGKEIWLDVRGQGYEVKKDGFGSAGVRFKAKAGGHQRIEVERTIIAKRLGRLTGAGLFGESQKLGREKSWKESGIVGCDSVQNTVHNGRLYWVWGDTVVPNYTLGIFDSTSATTMLKPITKFEPPLRVRLDYFKSDKGVPRGVAKMPGAGPTWLTGYVSLPDASGREHLVTSYMKIRNWLDAYQWGLATWNDATGAFEPFKILWEKSDTNSQPVPRVLDGHATKWTDSSGKAWVLFGDPFPTTRCPATFEAWQNTNLWESLDAQKTLQAAGSNAVVTVHSGNIAWNAWRKRWVTVFVESNSSGKPSALGEVWYAEADSPMGPWGRAVKILSHDNYTFYNPVVHPEFVADNSPVLIFEGTYTAEFANRPQVTPRYNYNQILYRLDLDDPRLLAAREK